MASLIRSARAFECLKIRLPTSYRSIFGLSLNRGQEETRVRTPSLASRMMHCEKNSEKLHSAFKPAQAEVYSGEGSKQSEQTQMQFMAFSWLPGLVVLCSHKDDSTDDLALHLPTYEDFKLTIESRYGRNDIIFTRVDNGEVIEVEFNKDDVMSSWLNKGCSRPLLFHVKIKSDQDNEKDFLCFLNKFDCMREQYIFKIYSLSTANGKVTKEVLGQTFDKCYEYLRRYGITQEFFRFLVNDFFPEYKEQCFAQQSDIMMKIFTDNN